MDLGLIPSVQEVSTPVESGVALAGTVISSTPAGSARFYTRFYQGPSSGVSLTKAVGFSVVGHGALLILAYVAVWLGFVFRLWEGEVPTRPTHPDIEFVLAPKDAPEVAPNNKHTRFRAQHAMKASGKAKPLAQTPVKPVDTPKLPQAKPQPGALSQAVSSQELDKALDAVIEAQGPVEQNTSTPTPDALADTTMRPYMEELKTRIHAAWHPPRGNDTKRVVLRFRMKHEGTLDGVWIQDSSGEALTDGAAVSAIEQTFPFRPLPDTIPDEKIDIEFTFDYKVFGDLTPSGENG